MSMFTVPSAEGRKSVVNEVLPSSEEATRDLEKMLAALVRLGRRN